MGALVLEDVVWRQLCPVAGLTQSQVYPQGWHVDGVEAEHTTEVSDIWAKCLESQAQASPMLQSTALSLVQSHRHCNITFKIKHKF